MEKYVGVKLIEAEPSMKNGVMGYTVVYPDGYVSWSPKETFERSYMQIGDNNTITEEGVDNFISEYDIQQYGDKTTVVHAKLNNGFIISETSSSVDPANFDIEIGADICKKDIKDKVWCLLGFVLQCGLNGITKK